MGSEPQAAGSLLCPSPTGNELELKGAAQCANCRLQPANSEFLSSGEGEGCGFGGRQH